MVNYTDPKEVLELLIDQFGLEALLEQNDISDLEVVELLWQRGLIDIDDYFFEDIEEDGGLE